MKKILLQNNLYCLVDDEDYEYLNQFKWRAVKNGKTYYVRRNVYIKGSKPYKWKTILLHHEIMGVPEKGFEIDHKDGNGLNNQKYNLQKVTHRVNCQNRHQDKTSKYPGVYWLRKHKRWVAKIQIKGKSKFLGNFLNEEKAYEAYKKAVEIEEAFKN
jgi:hypothetical protein